MDNRYCIKYFFASHMSTNAQMFHTVEFPCLIPEQGIQHTHRENTPWPRAWFTIFFHPLNALTINQVALAWVTCQVSLEGHTVSIGNMRWPQWRSAKHSPWWIHHCKKKCRCVLLSVNVPSKVNLLTSQKASLQTCLQVWRGQLGLECPSAPWVIFRPSVPTAQQCSCTSWEVIFVPQTK